MCNGKYLLDKVACGAGRALRGRPGGEFPCAAPDSEARQRRQGDAAAASAADHLDAGRPG